MAFVTFIQVFPNLSERTKKKSCVFFSLFFCFFSKTKKGAINGRSQKKRKENDTKMDFFKTFACVCVYVYVYGVRGFV